MVSISLLLHGHLIFEGVFDYNYFSQLCVTLVFVCVFMRI